MSIHTTFPDAIVFPDGTIRLVTRAAKDLAYANTNIRRIFSLSTADAVPDYLMFDNTIPEMFEDEGMNVKWERQPVGHYRSRRRRWPKSTPAGDGEVMDLFLHIPKHHRHDSMFRAYGRHRARNWRLMQERDEMRNRDEVRQDE